jgi:hypothetical protein
MLRADASVGNYASKLLAAIYGVSLGELYLYVIAHKYRFLLRPEYDTYPGIFELRRISKTQDTGRLKRGIQFCRGIRSEQVETKWIGKMSRVAARFLTIFSKDHIHKH